MKRYDRAQRVGDLIQKALATMLIADEKFRLVTIVNVTVSKDLSYAKVFVSVLLDDEAEVKQTLLLLNQNAKALRYELAHAVKLRIAPELKFVFDESTARGFRITSLINDALKKSDKK